MTITLCRPLLKASPCTCLDLLFEGRGRCDQTRRGPEQRDLHESRTSKNYQECHPKQGQLPLLFNIHNTAARPEQGSPRWCAPGKLNIAREKAQGLTETSEKLFVTVTTGVCLCPLPQSPLLVSAGCVWGLLAELAELPGCTSKGTEMEEKYSKT